MYPDRLADTRHTEIELHDKAHIDYDRVAIVSTHKSLLTAYLT
jgi:hypothetical protein